MTYTCSDTSNNEATATRTVNVEATPDTTDPVITINGDNPATITVDSTYTDAGATCNDAVDTVHVCRCRCHLNQGCDDDRRQFQYCHDRNPYGDLHL